MDKLIHHMNGVWDNQDVHFDIFLCNNPSFNQHLANQDKEPDFGEEVILLRL